MRYCEVLDTSLKCGEEDLASDDFLACISQLFGCVFSANLTISMFSHFIDFRTLQETHKAVQKMAQRKLLHRAIRAMSDQRRVAECKKKLANGFQAFQVCVCACANRLNPNSDACSSQVNAYSSGILNASNRAFLRYRCAAL